MSHAAILQTLSADDLAAVEGGAMVCTNFFYNPWSGREESICVPVEPPDGGGGGLGMLSDLNAP